MPTFEYLCRIEAETREIADQKAQTASRSYDLLLITPTGRERLNKTLKGNYSIVIPVRAAMERLGLNQMELAIKSRLSSSAIYLITSGSQHQVRYSTLRRLAEALNVTEDYLTSYTPDDLTPKKRTSIGPALRTQMEELGWSQTDVARKADIPKSLINKLVNGRRHSLSRENHIKLATALGVTNEYLISDTPEEQKTPIS